jgi:hypothetical protein
VNARQVHAVLAAGVQSPDLIERWQLDPRALEVHGIAQGALDLGTLWKFAGLSTKVRHNQLRARFPLTFRLLHVAGMEIEVFASYGSYRSTTGQRFASSTEQRAVDLIAFLKDWLDLRQRSHSMLWDLVRHEEALMSLGARPAAEGQRPSASPSPSETPDLASLPVLDGEIILHEMRCDPRDIAPLLVERVPPLDRLPLEPRHWCYWRSTRSTDIRMLELDEFGYYALALSDGVRSVAELSANLTGSLRPTPVFMRLLSDLAATGILRFTPGPAAGAA